MKKSKDHVFLNKVLFTLMIVVIYIVGRNISVYGIDVSAYEVNDVNAQSVFWESMTGDFRNISIFTLGLWPYMIASFLAIFYMAIRSLDKKNRMSMNHANIVTLVFMMIIGVIQAFQKVNSYVYMAGYNNIYVKSIVFVELITGMLWVIYMCDRNAKYGIGGKAAVFLANIYDGIFHMIAGKSWDEVKLPLLIGIIEATLMIILDNTEKRIPTLRVSIHSIYADKNYLAYKFIPVGVMPLMFCSAIFALVQIVTGLLAGYFPDKGNILWASSNMAMTRPLGMIVYIGIIWLINIVFSFVTLSPIKTADNFKKSGDSMENIYAGKKTTLYLVGCVVRLSVYSSIVFSIFTGIPFLMYLYGYFDSTLMLLPTSMMMSTGLWLMFYRESEVYIHYDRYRAFI